jgi:Short C-terminal domain
MGLMDAFKSMRMKDPVDGTAEVVSTTAAPDGATHGSAVMQLVVQVEGMEAQSIECTSVPTPVKKWPQPGQPLPVTIDRADPSKCKVRWDEVPEWGDIAKQQADARAAQMNQGGGSQVVQGDATDLGGLIEALQQQYPGAEIQVEGAQVQQGAAPPSGRDDRVVQLERLAKLRDSGALSEQEFEREKARILGQ